MRTTTKYERRDKKRHKKQHGMRISGRSLLTILDTQRKRYERAERVRHEDVAERS